MTNILYRVVRRWGVVDQVSGMLTSIIEYETPKVVTVHNVSIGQSATRLFRLYKMNMLTLYYTVQ